MLSDRTHCFLGRTSKVGSERRSRGRVWRETRSLTYLPVLLVDLYQAKAQKKSKKKAGMSRNKDTLCFALRKHLRNRQTCNVYSQPHRIVRNSRPACSTSETRWPQGMGFVRRGKQSARRCLSSLCSAGHETVHDAFVHL